MNFSVLMSIYHKESPEYFNRAMQSIWDDQTVKPNEIILVKDGKLTQNLDTIIAVWQKKLGINFLVIELKENVGLGKALNIGLNKCSYELIARMDTDDIASKDRFEKQLKIFTNNNIDICGTWVSEFEYTEKKIISYRKLPELHQKIISFSKKRNPMNHPSIMYKKSSVQSAGGYKEMLWFEDYYLWVRMIMNGSQFYNIQEALVNMRAGYSLLERRSGFKYAINEFKFQKELLNLKYINYSQFIYNIIIRFIIRILPKKFIRLIYKILRH